MDLSGLLKMDTINHKFHSLIENLPIIVQARAIIKIVPNVYVSSYFGHLLLIQETIKYGYCEYLEHLTSKYRTTLCLNKHFFINSCIDGQLGVAKVLLKQYQSVDIHSANELAFGTACSKNHMDMAKWLIYLGENGYGAIDIHSSNEFAFNYSCINGHLNVAEWLIYLGENGYGRINIHALNNKAIRTSYNKGHIHIVEWLIDLSKNHGYGEFPENLIQ